MKFSDEVAPGIRMEYGPDVWKRGHDITIVLVNELKHKNQVTVPESQAPRDPNGR
jgi:hypothetical protein